MNLSRPRKKTQYDTKRESHTEKRRAILVPFPHITWTILLSSLLASVAALGFLGAVGWLLSTGSSSRM